MDSDRLDNLAALMQYRELLLSRSSVVCKELQAVTQEIEQILEHSPHSTIDPAIIVAHIENPADYSGASQSSM
jgi:hypothetical protein